MSDLHTFDLAILGATPAGITTAIAAARRGRTSVILERSAFIGGLPANGLGATDIATRGATAGLFLDFVRRIKAYYISAYGEASEQVCDCDDGYHFEPSVAEKVFLAWLAEFRDKVQVKTLRQFNFEEPDGLSISSGDSGERRITAITVTDRGSGEKETYDAGFFVDASYEGDLIAAAGVPFFVGREGADVYGEVGAGQVYKLWRGPECAGTTHAGDNAVQAFNFRLCLTDDPANMSPITCPADYRRNEFTSLVSDVKTGLHAGVEVRNLSEAALRENVRRAEEEDLPPLGLPDMGQAGLAGITRLLSNVRLPNRKVDANNQHLALISTDLPEENWPYATSGWAWRDRFAARLRSYTEGLLFFAQNDAELPAWFRRACSRWGWAADEYAENGGFPRQVYVREGRRMRGRHVFTANSALAYEGGRPPVHADSVTASHYALDSHAVRKREPHRAHLDGFVSYPSAPCTVPYGVMVPADAAGAGRSPVNLLAAVPVSASHIGFSTLRMEPCWMALGQAAGVAAAIALEEGVAAADVHVERLQRALLEGGAVLFYDKKIWDGSWAEACEIQWKGLHP